MPGGIIKRIRDKVADTIEERNTIAQFWGIAQRGIGVLVNNAYKDYPAPGQGDPAVTTPNASVYYKWDGSAFRSTNSNLSREDIDTLSELNAILPDDDLVSRNELYAAGDPATLVAQKLALQTEPTLNNVLTQLLVRDQTTGEIKIRNAGTFIESNGFIGVSAPAIGIVQVKINGLEFDLLYSRKTGGGDDDAGPP